MKTFAKIFMWLLFLIALVGTLLLGLDTFGVRPWASVQKHKVSDLDVDVSLAAERRYYLIHQKAILDGRIKAFKGTAEQKDAARKAVEEAVNHFARKDYDNADASMKLAKLALSSKWANYVKDQQKNRERLLEESKAESTAVRPTIPKGTEEQIQKKISELEEKLSSITDPAIDSDEAWLYLDRTLNALRSGNVRDANYFLTETEIAVENLISE